MSGNQDEARCCAAMEPLLHALVDGELDAANALRCETHVRSCASCAAELTAIRVTQSVLRNEDGLRHRAPERLRACVLEALDVAIHEQKAAEEARAPAPPAWLRRPLAIASDAVNAAAARMPGRLRRRWSWWKPGGLPALTLATGLAAGALLVAALPVTQRPWGAGPATPELRQEVLAGHIRSLLTDGHLTDVGSSDQHTVKPWFAGRLDFSPPVPDLAGQGFPLVGGRLDYLDGRPVAALVYRRRGHVINVFVWPDATAGAPATPVRAEAGTGADRGHAVLRWTQAGMAFWAVSDLNAAELADFARLFEEHATAPGTPPS